MAIKIINNDFNFMFVNLSISSLGESNLGVSNLGISGRSVPLD
jgi:hypothetical protein